MSLRVSLYLFSYPKWIECLSFTYGICPLGLFAQSKRITARTIDELDTCIRVGSLVHAQVEQVEALITTGNVVGQPVLDILADIDLGIDNPFLTHQRLSHRRA